MTLLWWSVMSGYIGVHRSDVWSPTEDEQCMALQQISSLHVFLYIHTVHAIALMCLYLLLFMLMVLYTSFMLMVLYTSFMLTIRKSKVLLLQLNS